jgi:hypothetical protein
MKLATVAFTVLTAAMASATNPFAPESKNTAQAQFVSKLIGAAQPTENSQLHRDLADQVDLTAYSVKFDRCQFVQSYSDNNAQQQGASSVLAVNHFAVFKLCPASSCSTCKYGFGEYLIDLDLYLEYAVDFQKNNQTEMCNACANCVDATATSYPDCSICTDECTKIANMEANGYIDASTFLQCQMIYDPDDDTAASLYAGVVCTGNGGKIKIGVFTDDACTTMDTSKVVDDYLVDADGYQMKLSHAILKTAYDSTCVACSTTNDAGEVQQTDYCSNLYQMSAKCESKYGFTTGVANYDEYDNQAEQETLICNFIDSLTAGTYSESGEIIVSGGRVKSAKSGARKTTGGQKFALTFFILGTIGLAVFAGMLHQKLTKGGKTTMSNQGGALA